ncbi:MAG: hypothetical protein Q4F41_17625 [Eubacteriales bacterium]|nr:hypothetical protein [Eubacteriales bacterium]
MKKFIALALTLCMFFSTAVFAEDTSYTGKSSYTSSYPQTQVQTNIPERCTLIIPATITIPYGQASTDLPVTVTELHISDGKELYVRISTNPGYMALTDDATKRITYSITGGETVGSLSKALFFTSLGQKNYTININDNQWPTAYAGDYSQTLTFTFAIAKISRD